MRIEYLFCEDCPSHEQGLERLQEVLSEEGVTAEVKQIRVGTEEEARRLRFVGSPTIRIDGVDIDPGIEKQEHYPLTCRIYRWEDGRISPLPSKEMIRQALRRSHKSN